jgi:hypothetical protein
VGDSGIPVGEGVSLAVGVSVSWTGCNVSGMTEGVSEVSVSLVGCTSWLDTIE